MLPMLPINKILGECRALRAVREHALRRAGEATHQNHPIAKSAIRAAKAQPALARARSASSTPPPVVAYNSSRSFLRVELKVLAPLSSTSSAVTISERIILSCHSREYRAAK